MKINTNYAKTEPLQSEIKALEGPTVLEFGAPWCSYCRAVQSLLATAFEAHVNVQHIKIEDGKGQPLGRSYRITLWPTLIFLKDGKEVTRLVRPADSALISEALAKIL